MGTLDAQDVADYYRHDVGTLPPQIETALREVPEALAGYMGIRQFVWSDDADGLPKPIVNLIFTLLDVQTNNLYGATNHARAALEAGLPWKHLMQGLVQLWIVSGFASTWGTVGYQLVRQLRHEGLGPADPDGREADR